MGSKVDAPAVPNYEPIAAANEKTADRAFELAEEQFDWSKQQYNQIAPYVLTNMEEQTKAAASNRAFSEQQRQAYQSEYAPVERKFVDEVEAYGTPERASQNAALAAKDVETSIDAQRQAALTNLSSYGIDPSQTRYGALDASYRIAKAAAGAATRTQSRLDTEKTKLALMGEAINIGRGYPGAVNAIETAATGGAASGLKSASTQFAVGGEAMGSPTNYLGQSTLARQGQTQALNTGYQNQLAGHQLEAQSAADTLYGVGNIIGAVGRTAIGFGMK